MDTQYLKRLGMVGLLLVSTTLVSCQDTIPERATITAKSNISTKDPICTDQEELAEETDPVTKIISKKCVPKEPTRPSDAISFKADFCACKDGKAISFGNCSAYCATKGTSGTEQLFASFDVTAAITLSGLNSVRGWCTTIISSTAPNPKCEIEAKDSEQNIIRGQIISFPTNNSVVADIGNLSNDKTYVITLVEATTGARSKPAQIIKPSVETPISMLGPLKNAPISQYACVIRQFSSLEPDLFYEKAYRVHFYYLPRLSPGKVDASNIFCHDIVKYGIGDDETYPRFENIPGVFNLWDSTDPRFYDNDGNGNDDIYDLIVQKTKNFGGNLSAATKFFIKFSWPGSPTLNDDAGNNATTSTTQPIGFYMAPWIDQQNQFKSFCLTSANYNTTNALFKAFRDVIGVDTEGLYVGEKAAETVFDPNGTIVGTGVKDYILIRETDLKQIWFYMKNGVPTAPTDDNVANVAVYFYYPMNKASPFIKSSTQRIYRVRGGSELSNGNTSGAAPSGGGTSYPPHDRKIGCIPKF